jgi:hypothetical protein
MNVTCEALQLPEHEHRARAHQVRRHEEELRRRARHAGRLGVAGEQQARGRLAGRRGRQVAQRRALLGLRADGRRAGRVQEQQQVAGQRAQRGVLEEHRERHRQAQVLLDLPRESNHPNAPARTRGRPA